MNTPNGYEQVVRMFGCPSNHDMSLNEDWRNENIVSYKPPVPLIFTISYDTDEKVTTFQIHKDLKDNLDKVFTEIWNTARIMVKKQYPGLSTPLYDIKTQKLLDSLRLTYFGGGFNYRAKRGTHSLSMHSFGIALDWDPDNNPLGSKKTTLPKWFINIWKKNGWVWGGDFRNRKDPMHFQFAKGI